VISTPASPQGPAQISLCINRIVTRNCSITPRLPGFGILARRDHRMGISRRNRLMAFASVICPVCGDTADVLDGIWFRSSGNMGVSPMLLPVSSTARNSSVPSPIPMCVLRQIPRLEPPCLRAFRSPSPSALIPVLSKWRFSGPPRTHNKVGSRSVPSGVGMKC
jgi:hypothetical protein